MNKVIHLAAEAMLAGLMLLLYAGQAQAGDELRVDDDGAQCSDASYLTIQDAVDFAAGAGGSWKIHICEGTYPENVTIGAGNDSIEIFGDGADKTFVTGVADTAGPIFDVTDAGVVNIEKLTVDGESALVGVVVWGVRYTDTDGLFKDNAILNIRNNSGSAQGVAIRIQTTTGGTAYVDVEDNLVQNFTRVGINGNGIGAALYVKDNEVIGPVDPKVWAPNGIQVARGAVGQVEGNHVQDSTSPNPPAGAGSGILMFCAGPSEVVGNKVFDSDLGIALGDNADAQVIGNEVNDSTFDAYSLQYIGTFFGDVLGCPLFPSPTENNLLEGNKAFGSADTGVSLVNFDPDDPEPPDNNDIVNTDIKDSGVDGIHVFDGMGNLFENNQIDNSGGTDCVDDTAGSGTEGTGNTWKDNDGASSSPAGICTD